MFQILIIFQPLVSLRKHGEELQVLTALFINTRIRKSAVMSESQKNHMEKKKQQS